jgi:hypothetical protein
MWQAASVRNACLNEWMMPFLRCRQYLMTTAFQKFAPLILTLWLIPSAAAELDNKVVRPIRKLSGTETDPERIDYARLPVLEGQHAIVNAVAPGPHYRPSDPIDMHHHLRLNLHNYAQLARLNVPSPVSLPESVSRIQKKFSAGIASLQYPHVIEHNGFLLIAPSRGKVQTEVFRVALDDVDSILNVDRNSPQPSRNPSRIERLAVPDGGHSGGRPIVECFGNSAAVLLHLVLRQQSDCQRLPFLLLPFGCSGDLSHVSRERRNPQ